MFNSRFTPQAKGVFIAAERVARQRGDRTLEAEHLLIALAELGEPELAEVDVPAVLDRQFEHALSAAGVDVKVPAPKPRLKNPGVGASAKRAIERAFHVAIERGDRKVLRGHMLLGVLSAEEGTVPRALSLAGIDRGALASRVRTRL
jgi:ATP-dependent Clp protease ATP-binding subunit ClpA